MSEPNQPGNRGRYWLLAALVVSLIGLSGSLYASLGLGLKACTLCFYQRAFIMGLAAVLLVGLLTGAGRLGKLGLIALPLAAAGLGVALFHVRLELTGKLECPQGFFGLGTVPQQSLAAFALIFLLLLGAVLRSSPMSFASCSGLCGGVVLGGLLAWASSIRTRRASRRRRRFMPIRRRSAGRRNRPTLLRSAKL